MILKLILKKNNEVYILDFFKTFMTPRSLYNFSDPDSFNPKDKMSVCSV